MFSKALLVILLAGAIVSDLTYAQQIQGSIEDYETKSPISYALITNTKRTVGISTDSAGFFKIPSNLSSQFDSIQVSAIGYKTTVVALEGTKYLTIILQKNTVEIKATQERYNSAKNNKITLGSLANFINPMYGCYVDSSANTEIAILIKNPKNKTGRIETIGFFLRSMGVINAPFRIRVYHNNKDKPGEEITTRNIIVRGYRKNAWNKFDVSPYNLILPLDGCFISMEWLNWGDEKYRYEIPDKGIRFGTGPTISLTDEFPVTINYRRNNWGNWYKTTHIFWNNVRLKDYNPMINIEAIL